MDIIIKEHNDCVSLHLEVLMEPGSKKYKPIDAIGWLEKRGYKVGECVRKDVVRNETEREKLRKGHWIFKLLKGPKEAKPVMPRAAKKKTTKKSYVQLKPAAPVEENTTEE
jgi:hypothetical protein|tara:strand:+ start:760 stop:1092 length:333 start_codon:yes stop_codon:yes gene_type:complete